MINIGRDIYEIQISGNGGTNLHIKCLIFIFIKTCNTKNICIDFSDQLVKFDDHIHKVICIPINHPYD